MKPCRHLLYIISITASSLFIITSIIFPPHVQAQLISKPAVEALDTAESFFVALRNKEFRTVWNTLSRDSQSRIITEVYKSFRSMGGSLSKNKIRHDFDNSGIMFTNYWNAFIRNFDANMVLEESRWEMGNVNANRAEILITHNNSKNPAQLMMYHEDGSWKVGLSETFWNRKYID